MFLLNFKEYDLKLFFNILFLKKSILQKECYTTKGAPFSQEQIDEIRKASALEKEEAKEHIQNSWAALGNNLPGDVIKESYLAWECLRNSEKLDRQACNMENTNIDYENTRR